MTKTQTAPSKGSTTEASVDGASSRGPVAPVHRPQLIPLPLDAVTFAPGGRLGEWQQLNGDATIPHCIENLESSGNLDNLRRLLSPSDQPFRGFWFADSDLHKTLEAVGWESARGLTPGVGHFVDEAVALIASAQEDDGYLHSWVQGRPGQARWDELRWSHEMYCAGHLMQGAVALSRGSGDRRLLVIARKLADLLVAEFGEGARDLYDGHPEVETALVELYRETGHTPYLELAKRQVELRGRGLFGGESFGAQYFQDHAPVREATEAIGHAVRQLYFAAGVTDVYLETGDESLLEAMKELWDSAFTTKTYITGAHGSRHRDEAYGDPYELPPDRAYAETCAAIAAFQWSWRMLLATGEGKYAEEMERALYNGIAVSTSCSGRQFFYSNPLQLRTGHDGTSEDAPSERLDWYSCACCPPNLARLIASLQAYVATSDSRGVQLHLVTAGTVRANAPDGSAVTIRVETEYPWDGTCRLDVSAAASSWELAVRIPAWCGEPSITVNGRPVRVPVGPDGYVRIECGEGEGTVIGLDLPMPVRAVSAHPRVDAVRGCIALARGPLVYCIEQVDQPEGDLLEDIRIDPASLPQPVPGTSPGVVTQLVGEARVFANRPSSLYGEPRPQDAAATHETTITAIPYFRWANRGSNAMRVWIPTT